MLWSPQPVGVRREGVSLAGSEEAWPRVWVGGRKGVGFGAGAVHLAPRRYYCPLISRCRVPRTKPGPGSPVEVVSEPGEDGEFEGGEANGMEAWGWGLEGRA